MFSKKSIIRHLKTKDKLDPFEAYWNLEDNRVLSLEIEKNGGRYLIVNGPVQALEYVAGMLADNNVPHRNKRNRLEVFLLSPSELEASIKGAYLPFNTAIIRKN